MAYKQKGCTPITAKIQKTTKGGVTNPLLKAMGVPMKDSPNKFVGTKGTSKDKSKKTMEGNLVKRPGASATVKIPKLTDFNNYVKADGTMGHKPKEFTVDDTILSTKKRGVKAESTGNDLSRMKKGSKARYDEYKRRGWAQDDTTKGYVASKKPASKVKTETIKKAKVEKTPEIKISAKATTKTTPKTKKNIRVENRTNRKSARKENRANRKATREENKANRKAARNASPAKQNKPKKGNKRVKQKMGEAVILPVKEKAVNTSKAPAGYSEKTRKDMAAKKAVAPNKKLRKASSARKNKAVEAAPRKPYLSVRKGNK